MADLNFDNILDGSELDLFSDTGEESKESQDPPKDNEEEETEKEDSTAEINPEGLFDGQEKSEEVGGEENKQGKEDAELFEGEGSSPKTDFFSTIAETFVEEGILPNLDIEQAKNIKTANDLREAINNYIQSELTEQQQRVNQVLDNGGNVSEAKQYENVINYLDSISDDALKDESEEGENLRKRLLYQDYVNRGFSEKRAEREVQKAFDSGNDIEDAIEALTSNKEFYASKYKELRDAAQKKADEERALVTKRMEQMKSDIIEGKTEFFQDLDLDKNTRQKIFDNISKPVYQDKESGQYYTAVQKFSKDNQEEFITKLGVIFTLTDGFKNLNGLVKNKVKKEVKKGFNDLESRINNTSRDMYGNLNYTSGVSGDDDSYLGKGIRLAL